jgi:urate oxidase
VHEFVEWTVDCILDSDMGHAFMTSSNEGMTATDTQKNTVYYMAKKMSEPCAPEAFAVALCSHFVETYPLVFRAKVSIEVVPWGRFHADLCDPHDHGFVCDGNGCRTCVVSVDKVGNVDISAGIKNLKVLKTTQSGYAGFIHDKFTTLPDVSDRILATAISCTWR